MRVLPLGFAAASSAGEDLPVMNAERDRPGVATQRRIEDQSEGDQGIGFHPQARALADAQSCSCIAVALPYPFCADAV